MSAWTVRRNPPVDSDLTDALADVWARVTNAGGAVGFVPTVAPGDVRPTAAAELDRVAAGHDDLVVAYEGQRVVAFGFLSRSSTPVTGHVGVIRRLQRDPDAAGRGRGAEVLAALEACAWDRGLELVTLTVRGGTGRERFYAAHGYRLDARMPGRLRLADGTLLEELHLSKARPGSRAAEAPVLQVRRLDPELPLPAYAHPGDAGLDLFAAVDVRLAPGMRALVPTGLAVAVPDGHVGLVHPRSGLAVRQGISLVNAPGTIDAGYRGEVQVPLINHDTQATAELARGDRIAQLVIQRVETARVVEVETLPAAARGEGGFGSTGR